MDLPPYIDLPGSGEYSMPYTFTGVNQQVFVLSASLDRLKSVTDQWLNAIPGSDYRFEPLFPFVMCSPIWIDRVTSPDWNGWMHESEITFAYYVACFRGVLLDHIAVVIPYLVVDNPRAVLEGREICGYRKVSGEMEYVAGTWQPCAASTGVFKTRLPDERWQTAEVVRILPPPVYGSAVRDATWEDIHALEQLAGQTLVMDVAVAIEHGIAMFKTLSIRNVFVVQLRDAEYSASAGYQALIEMPLEITNLVYARALPDGFSVKLTDYASYPLISDLGIEVDENNVAKSLLSYQAYFNAVLQHGRVLHVGGRTAPSL